MENVENIFTYRLGQVVNKELGKLISYAYDLHEKDFSFCYDIPILEDMPGKKTVNGGIYGRRYKAADGADYIVTQMAVYKEEEGMAYFLETYDEEYDTLSSRMKLTDDRQYIRFCRFIRNISTEEFIEAMVLLGFNEDDIIAVGGGKMTAKEAFEKVTPNFEIGKQKVISL